MQHRATNYGTECYIADPSVCQVKSTVNVIAPFAELPMQKTNRTKTAGINALMKMQPTLRDRITKHTCQWPSSIATACFAQNGIFKQLKLLLLDIGTHVCSYWSSSSSWTCEGRFVRRIVAFQEYCLHTRSLTVRWTYNMSQEFPADQSARLMWSISIVIIQSQLVPFPNPVERPRLVRFATTKN